MNTSRLSVFRAITLLVTTMVAVPSYAAPAGTVIFSKGAVSADREPPVSLAKGDEVWIEDTISTGAAASVQLLMLDGARIGLLPDSRLKIEEYVYARSGDPGTRDEISAAGKRSVTSLTKGGFSSISGKIGEVDETANFVRTPLGVLGIRGSNYTVVLCLADCDRAPGFGQEDSPKDGLYLSVMAGTIIFRNELGVFEINAGEFAFVSMADRKLHLLSGPSAIMFDGYNLSVGEADAGASGRVLLRFDGRLGTRREPGKPALDNDGNDKYDQDSEKTPALPILITDPDGTIIDITSGELPQ